jgi:hypothetical protein
MIAGTYFMRHDFLLLLLLLLGSLTVTAAAQEATPTPPAPAFATNTPMPNPALNTTAYQRVVVYAGPGATFPQLTPLNAGVPAVIVERNAVGTWVRLQRQDAGQVVMDGWVISGYLNLDPALDFGAVPVNTALADADPANEISQSLQRLMAVPVIPTIDPAMAAVIQAGRQMGNDHQGVSKVGDSLIANEMYLQPLGADQIELGAYRYLLPAVDWFRQSAAQSSVAARVGLTSLVIFDPFWADKALCQPGETPLACEYRLKRPAVALISFGANDVRHVDEVTYAGQLRRIVDESMAAGVLPVLFTFSYSSEAEFWPQAVNLNLAVIEVAAEKQVPVVNLWLAARILPDYGLDVDQTHLKNSGFNFIKFTGGNEAFYGVTLQNLLALRTLDAVRQFMLANVN